MKIWGKVFGVIIGFMFGRFFGALLGLWLGHAYDRRQGMVGLLKTAAQRQAQFFNSTFAVMGHVAKASGQVTETDIRIATMLMQQMRLQGDAKRDAQNAFREGKQADFDLEACLQSFRQIAGRRTELLKMFLEIQIQTALADGELHPKELQVLSSIAKQLGFSQQQLESMLERWKAEFKFQQSASGSNTTSEADAYQLLGLTGSSSDKDIKRAYRKLMNEHHPDKLVAKGLPNEMMELAKRKAQDIQAAYDKIKHTRGFK
ncbi:co-chaperone DjlA [Parashewanella spongiae]|uniref:Co-chaperone protein DjlA n=1 Tax=Parashewanella spongiae TaxID=342950 RepID=A0A3A6ULD4_9GAMM|nr:co-chaperone DjlA [Parashewanella spongiae]MCL1076669.1 co-chaperone DjlA [Parashewanella spongiae]RJY18478.1 co-chaperone DjlA [Parashewanella spongiae]